MKRYVIQLKKVIVIEIDAASKKEALDSCNIKDAFSDSWYYAEPVVEILATLSNDTDL